jgi:transaldolase/glucose-6-phosphate isomerase
MKVAISSDHAGFELKQLLVERLSNQDGLTFTDLGVHAAAPPSDYPDAAAAVAEAVVRGDADRGITVCGSGAGVSIAANKIPGAYAFAAEDTYTGHQAVEHDNANVLCLGERVTGEELAVEIARAFLQARFTGEDRHVRRVGKIARLEAANSNPLDGLRINGQSVWLDTISRSMVTSGDLRRYAWDDHVVGMTSNPTIFEKAMGHEPEYEEPARRLADQGLSTEDIYWALAIEDIQSAADVMASVYRLTNGLDGYISLECAPAVANDTQATIDMTADLWRRLDRPNVFIKIPATPAGVPAIEQSIASGINVNVTLMFSVELYDEVARAYIKGLQRFFAGNERTNLARADSLVKAPVSVASFFVSRVDTLVDKLLNEKMAATKDGALRARLQSLLGRAAVDNAVIAYQHFKQIFAGPGWEDLAKRGARVQRPLWASTSTKNPAYSDVMYVEELVGPDTVNTVPLATLAAIKDHARIARTVDSDGSVARANATFKWLKEVGVDMDEVTLQLQHEGVELFSESFDSLLKELGQRREALVGAGAR